MKKSALLCLACLVASFSFASITSMYLQADNAVSIFNYSGYSEYWRYGSPDSAEPRLEHVIAYYDQSGVIVRAESFRADNGTYDYKEQLNLSGTYTEQSFREMHILPYGGDSLSDAGGNSGNGGNPGGGSTGSGGGDSSGSGGGGSSIGDSGSAGGGGGVGYACTSAGGGEEVCVRIY